MTTARNNGSAYAFLPTPPTGDFRLGLWVKASTGVISHSNYAQPFEIGYGSGNYLQLYSNNNDTTPELRRWRNEAGDDQQVLADTAYVGQWIRLGLERTGTTWTLYRADADDTSWTVVTSWTNANTWTSLCFLASVVDLGNYIMPGAWIRSARLYTGNTMAQVLTDLLSATPTLGSLWAAWFDGSTASLDGSDSSGNSRPLTVVGTFVLDADDPIAASGLTATLQGFASRSKRGPVSSATARTLPARTARSQRTSHASGLGAALPSRANSAERTSASSVLGATQQTRFSHPTATVTTSAFAHTQHTRATRHRWSIISASADAIVSLFTAAARTRFGKLASSLAVTSTERRQRPRAVATAAGLSATHASADASSRPTPIATAANATLTERPARHARGNVNSSQAANVATRPHRQRRTSISGSADAFVSLFTTSVRSRFRALSSSTSATVATGTHRSRATAITVGVGALLAAVGTRIARLRFGSVASAINAALASARTRVAPGRPSSAFTGVVQATRRALSRFGTVVSGVQVPILATLRSFTRRLVASTITFTLGADTRRFPVRLGDIRVRRVVLGDGRVKRVVIEE